MAYKDYYQSVPNHGKVSLVHNKIIKSKLKTVQSFECTKYNGEEFGVCNEN